jgi:hypothetical protein
MRWFREAPEVVAGMKSLREGTVSSRAAIARLKMRALAPEGFPLPLQHFSSAQKLEVPG